MNDMNVEVKHITAVKLHSRYDNYQYYIDMIKEGISNKFNKCAALFGPLWAIHRKLYLYATVEFVMLFGLFFMDWAAFADVLGGTCNINICNIGNHPIWFCAVLNILWGVFGNRLYIRNVKYKVAREYNKVTGWNGAVLTRDIIRNEGRLERMPEIKVVTEILWYIPFAICEFLNTWNFRRKTNRINLVEPTIERIEEYLSVACDPYCINWGIYLGIPRDVVVTINKDKVAVEQINTLGECSSQLSNEQLNGIKNDLEYLCKKNCESLVIRSISKNEKIIWIVQFLVMSIWLIAIHWPFFSFTLEEGLVFKIY